MTELKFNLRDRKITPLPPTMELTGDTRMVTDVCDLLNLDEVIDVLDNNYKFWRAIALNEHVISYPALFEFNENEEKTESEQVNSTCPNCADDEMISMIHSALCDDHYYYVTCLCCGIQGPTCGTEQEALDAWSRIEIRPADSDGAEGGQSHE